MSRLQPSATRVQQRAAEEMTVRLQNETSKMEDQLKKLQEDLLKEKSLRDSRSFVSGVAHWRSGAAGAVRGEYKAPRKLKQKTAEQKPQKATTGSNTDNGNFESPPETRDYESEKAYTDSRRGSASSRQSQASAQESHRSLRQTSLSPQLSSQSAGKKKGVSFEMQNDGPDAQLETLDLQGDFAPDEEMTNEFITVRNRKSWQFRPLSASKERQELDRFASNSKTLLDGQFDEEESQESFRQALLAWRRIKESRNQGIKESRNQ
eukprot:TRINITY_DN2078_c0_g1_i13.p1 TRINITY_DN2078_c0_g1~~TRINITY_DN2078_c0_g1_i13.p1  ORF type:complete len:264 (+),score=69.55 TRINITY_DN2078_c0_g1_i13:53-844(+)